jgi:hypothetical protein
MSLLKSSVSLGNVAMGRLSTLFLLALREEYFLIKFCQDKFSCFSLKTNVRRLQWRDSAGEARENRRRPSTKYEINCKAPQFTGNGAYVASCRRRPKAKGADG